jgi:glycosyltransferase involved in cell wall biosynthesis
VPQISIITPTYNSVAHISNAINSVINQDFKDWEMIIVDDCSSDNSVKLIESFMFRDKRLKLIKSNLNLGAAISRNIALDNCSGKYIAFLDSDDTWDPDFLLKTYQFTRDNNFEFVFSSYRIFDAAKKKYLDDFLVPEKVNYVDMLKKNSISCLTAFISKSLIGSLRMQKTLAEDYLFWLQILKKIDFAYGIQKPMATYNLHVKSSSKNKLLMAYSRWKIYRCYENLTLIQSMYYWAHYLLNGIRKYYL